MPVDPEDKEYMATLAKGLAVLRAFGEDRPTMTLSEAAAAVDLSRATARRILRTLAGLGYVEQDGRTFGLAPRVLELGFRYLSTQSWIDRALPLMSGISEALRGILLGLDPAGDRDRLCRARPDPPHHVDGDRGRHAASRLPHLDGPRPARLSRRRRSCGGGSTPRASSRYTPSTIVDLKALVERIQADRAQGFSIVDEELERGLRSIAVPLVSRGGRVVAALNVSAHTNRTTRNEMRERFLPRLTEAAKQISAAIA